MINIEKAKKVYKEYISYYNLENPKIALKITHIYRTAEKSKELAIHLGLSEEDIKLAELIGLLHDIGRFEQVKNYNTFVDRDSINHAEYGVKVLFEDNLIKNFIDDRQYDEIIYKAVINHNRNNIEEGLNERELMHCKIIRDADKLDIFNALLIEKDEAIYSFDKYPKEHISKEIKNEFIQNHKIDYSHIKTSADIIVSHIAFVFDINYLYTLIKIKENNYINKLITRYNAREKDTIEDINELKQIAQKYIQEKIEEEEICLKNY